MMKKSLLEESPSFRAQPGPLCTHLSIQNLYYCLPKGKKRALHPRMQARELQRLPSFLCVWVQVVLITMLLSATHVCKPFPW